MINTRFFNTFFVLTLIGAGLRAELPAEEFEQLGNSFDGMVKVLREQKLSGKQMMSISARMLELGQAIENTLPAKKKLLVSEPENVPEHVEKRAEHFGGGGQYFSPAKGTKRHRLEESEPVNKRLKFDSARTETGHAIYLHTIFLGNYTENPVPRFDAKKAWDNITDSLKKRPGTRDKTKRKMLYLEAEKHFRSLMKNDENLIKIVKYVGLCKNDEHRIKGHAQDLCDESKCLRTTKGIVESTVMSFGYNIRMHTVIENLTLAELPIFEALMAQIFPVQMFGASAVIANKEAFAEVQEYLGWKERFDTLKREGLDKVVEEQVERQLIWSLPRAWWPERLIPAFIKVVVGC